MVNHFIRTSILLLFVFFNNYNCYSQHYNLNTESWIGNKSYRVNYVGTDVSGNIFTKTNTQRFGKSKPWGKTFTPFGKNVIKEKPFFKKQFKKKGYTYVDLIVENNKAIILFKDHNKQGNNLYGIDTNHKLEFIGNPYKVGRMQNCRNRATSFTHQKSKNGERTFLSRFNCAPDTMIVLNRIGLTDQNMVFYDHNIFLDIKGEIRNLSVVGKGSDVYFAFDSKDESYLYVSDQTGNTERLIVPVKNNSFETADIEVSENKEGIFITGQIRGKMSKLFNGIFIGKINPKNRKVRDVKIFFYELSFIERFWDNEPAQRIGEKGKLKESNVSFRIVDRLNLDNGHTVYFVQKHYNQRIQVRVNYGTDFKANYSKEYNYFTDLLVTYLKPDGEPEWVVNLPLFQIFEDENPRKAFTASFKEGNVYIMHAARKDLAEIINKGEDYIVTEKLSQKNTENIALTRIKSDGSVFSKSVLSRKSDLHTFHPEKVGVDNTNKNFLIFNSQRRFILPNRIVISSLSF